MNTFPNQVGKEDTISVSFILSRLNLIYRICNGREAFTDVMRSQRKEVMIVAASDWDTCLYGKSVKLYLALLNLDL